MENTDMPELPDVDTLSIVIEERLVKSAMTPMTASQAAEEHAQIMRLIEAKKALESM